VTQHSPMGSSKDQTWSPQTNIFLQNAKWPSWYRLPKIHWAKSNPHEKRPLKPVCYTDSIHWCICELFLPTHH
jgi:hypothetical protein